MKEYHITVKRIAVQVISEVVNAHDEVSALNLAEDCIADRHFSDWDVDEVYPHRVEEVKEIKKLPVGSIPGDWKKHKALVRALIDALGDDADSVLLPHQEALSEFIDLEER